MSSLEHEFCEFIIESGALTFGSFTLKSGRVSPYFFNAGVFCTGKLLSRLAYFYAQALTRSGINYNLLFGPAYKGIPLATALSLTLYNEHNLNVGFAYDRKEVKDHGEGGRVVGAKLVSQEGPMHVLIVDDVVTAGTAIQHASKLIASEGAIMCGVLLALDRQERVSATSKLSAVESIKGEYGVEVVCVASMVDVVEYLRVVGWNGDEIRAIEVYREEYGV